jgi:peptide-methionine (S)-S-oxide reductase
MKSKRLFGALVLALAALANGSASLLGKAAAEGKPALSKATFAGGCFWCMESDFEKVPGVVSVTSGYTGGKVKNPSYEEVSSGGTGHVEAIEIAFDPGKITYEKLVAIFWSNIDPLDEAGQFCDHGEQYHTVIFVHDDAQKRAAEESKKAVEQKLKAKVATLIATAGPFYPAEEHHQKYSDKNPVRYGLYRNGCGRDRKLEQIWGAAPAQGHP